MFGKQTDPSRTEDATPKRRNKQRKEGNVPRSQEASKCMSLLAGLIGLTLWISTMGHLIMRIFRRYLRESCAFVPTEDSLYGLALSLFWHLAIILLPLLFFLAFCAWLIIRLQVGKLWTTQVFKFKFSRFNIINGLKQMLFSPMTLFRLLKSLGFALIIGSIPTWFLWHEYVRFLPMYYATPQQVMEYMLKSGFTMCLYVLIPMIGIAVLDIWQSRYAYNESIKMTKEEVKDERKQAEGDEKVKSEIRQKMLRMTARRMLRDVPRADVVVTNPTHYAVALKYDPLISPAPVVLAKGADKVALKIKEIARENNVPLRENVALARALFAACEVGDSIPEELYKATAALLASIWRMQGRQPPRRAE